MSDNTPSQGVIMRTHIEVPCRRQEPETQAVRFGIGPAFPKPLEIKRLSPRWTKRERAIAAFILAGIEGAAMRQCTDSARAVVLPFPPRPRRIEVHISAIRGRQPIGRTRPDDPQERSCAARRSGPAQTPTQTPYDLAPGRSLSEYFGKGVCTRGIPRKRRPVPGLFPGLTGRLYFPRQSAEIATNRRNADCPRIGEMRIARASRKRDYGTVHKFQSR
jgi:hypothetical protein